MYVLKIIGRVDIGEAQLLSGLSDTDIHGIGAGRPRLVDDAVV